MNMVFIFLGGAVVLEAWLGLRGYRFHQVILILKFDSRSLKTQ
jgi:hypothetical protein